MKQIMITFNGDNELEAAVAAFTDITNDMACVIGTRMDWARLSDCKIEIVLSDDEEKYNTSDTFKF
jgi:hypothetical protein